MHGSLIKPLVDTATRTFIQRCEELGLWVWAFQDARLRGLDTEGHQPSEEIEQAINDHLGELVNSAVPVTIADGLEAAWVEDHEGPNPGYVVATARSRAGLGEAARALAWNLADLRRIDQNQFAVEDLTEQLGLCYENITLLYGIGRSMSSVETPREVAQGICDQMRITQGYGWSAVRFKEDTEDISGLNDACLITGEMPCQEPAFREVTGRMLSNWDDLSWTKLLQIGQHELADLLKSEVILDPIRHDGKVIGAVLAGGKTGPDAEATSGDTQLLDAIAGFLGALHENAARFIEQKNMFIGSLEAVSAALDAKDRYTYGHSERVAWLGTQLAEAIGISADEVERIRISGLVHDVGKIGVPEAVLCKTGRLTEDEFEQIKKHPRIGYNILKGIPKMADVLDGVLYHHERWDGRGYPDKLAGEAIPLYGRILAVADTFDAMSSTRSYRQAMPREKVLQEIAACSGTQFDPSLTDPFIALDFAEYDAMVARHQGDSAAPDQERAA